MFYFLSSDKIVTRLLTHQSHWNKPFRKFFEIRLEEKKLLVIYGINGNSLTT